MKVRVFASTERNHSIDRYTRELAAHFPADVDAQAVYYERSGGLFGRTWQRYVGYPHFARAHSGDLNIIAAETYSHLALALPRERTIVVCHDVHPLCAGAPRGLRVALYRTRFRLSLRFMQAARRVVTVSEYTRRELLAHCPFLAADKVVAILSGINEEWKRVEDGAIIESFRNLFQLGNRRIVLHVGNDVWYKNVPGAITAFAGLGDDDLMLVQAGSLTSASQELVTKSGIGGRFLHLQNLNDEELRTLYSASELLLFPSWSEGFGWPPLEAMACGCPVIASDRGSLPEVCGEAALTINPDQPESITAAIRKLLESPSLRAELAAKGREQAKRFSWQRTAQAMLDLIQH